MSSGIKEENILVLHIKGESVVAIGNFKRIKTDRRQNLRKMYLQ